MNLNILLIIIMAINGFRLIRIVVFKLNLCYFGHIRSNLGVRSLKFLKYSLSWHESTIIHVMSFRLQVTRLHCRGVRSLEFLKFTWRESRIIHVMSFRLQVPRLHCRGVRSLEFLKYSLTWRESRIIHVMSFRLQVSRLHCRGVRSLEFLKYS